MKIKVSSFQFPVSSMSRSHAASPRIRASASSAFIAAAKSRNSPRAFSLVEVLLAVFILGIGMIMVASVFPVGANWTRQTTETSVAQNIAQAAITVIKTHYGPGGDLEKFLASDFIISPGNVNGANANSVLRASGVFPNPSTPFVLQALPGFLPNSIVVPPTRGIPASERAYQFGSSSPFPAPVTLVNGLDFPADCTYFWSALIRLNPAHKNLAALPTGDPTNGITISSSYKYDLYILVFRKGALENAFPKIPSPVLSGYAEIPGLRDLNNDGNIGYPERLIPSIGYLPYSAGSHDPARTPSVYAAMPPVGQYGIGAISGTVFRQGIDTVSKLDFTTPGGFGAMPRPLLFNQSYDGDGKFINPGTENIIYSPPASGTNANASPLIYIYQTTLSF